MAEDKRTKSFSWKKQKGHEELRKQNPSEKNHGLPLPFISSQDLGHSLSAGGKLPAYTLGHCYLGCWVKQRANIHWRYPAGGKKSLVRKEKIWSTSRPAFWYQIGQEVAWYHSQLALLGGRALTPPARSDLSNTPGCACMLDPAVMADSLWPHGLYPTRLLCPWDSPGKNTGVGCHALLQGILLTQASNLHFLYLLHWQAGSLPPRKSNTPGSMLFGPFYIERRGWGFMKSHTNS